MNTVAFSPDGMLALTGSVDGAARIWLIGFDLLVEEALQRIRQEYRKELENMR